MLERSHLYRRSTAYFDSGILKLYEEPLKEIIRTEGKIHLLMDWQGFTKQDDIASLERLHDPDYRGVFLTRSLQEFVETLAEQDFTSTELLAETIDLTYPPQSSDSLRVKSHGQEYDVTPTHPPRRIQRLGLSA
jgi:hypothetical protein